MLGWSEAGFVVASPLLRQLGMASPSGLATPPPAPALPGLPAGVLHPQFSASPVNYDAQTRSLVASVIADAGDGGDGNGGSQAAATLGANPHSPSPIPPPPAESAAQQPQPLQQPQPQQSAQPRPQSAPSAGRPPAPLQGLDLIEHLQRLNALNAQAAQGRAQERAMEELEQRRQESLAAMRAIRHQSGSWPQSATREQLEFFNSLLPASNAPILHHAEFALFARRLWQARPFAGIAGVPGQRILLDFVDDADAVDLALQPTANGLGLKVVFGPDSELKQDVAQQIAAREAEDERVRQQVQAQLSTPPFTPSVQLPIFETPQSHIAQSAYSTPQRAVPPAPYVPQQPSTGAMPSSQTIGGFTPAQAQQFFAPQLATAQSYSLQAPRLAPTSGGASIATAPLSRQPARFTPPVSQLQQATTRPLSQPPSFGAASVASGPALTESQLQWGFSLVSPAQEAALRQHVAAFATGQQQAVQQQYAFSQPLSQAGSSIPGASTVSQASGQAAQPQRPLQSVSGATFVGAGGAAPPAGGPPPPLPPQPPQPPAYAASSASHPSHRSGFIAGIDGSMPIAANGWPDAKPSKEMTKAIQSEQGTALQVFPQIKEGAERASSVQAWMSSFLQWAEVKHLINIVEGKLIWWKLEAPVQPQPGTLAAMHYAAHWEHIGPPWEEMTENQMAMAAYEKAATCYVRLCLEKAVQRNEEMHATLLASPTPLITPFLNNLIVIYGSAAERARDQIFHTLQHRKQGRDEPLAQYQAAFKMAHSQLLRLGGDFANQQWWTNIFISHMQLTDNERSVLAAHTLEHPHIKASIDAVVNFVQDLRAAAATQRGGSTGKTSAVYSGSFTCLGASTNTRANSPCKLCHQLGHWANKCPQRGKGDGKSDVKPAESKIDDGKQQQQQQQLQSGSNKKPRGGRGGRRQQDSKSSERSQSASRALVCSNCNLRGHAQERCFKLHPNLAPEGWAKQQAEREEARRAKAQQRQQERKQSSGDAKVQGAVFHLNATANMTLATDVLNGATPLFKSANAAHHAASDAHQRFAHSHGEEFVAFLDSGCNLSVAPPSLPLFNVHTTEGNIRTAGSQVLDKPSVGYLNLGKMLSGDDANLTVLQHDELRVVLFSVSQLLSVSDITAVNFEFDGAVVYSVRGPVLRATLVDGQYQVLISDISRMLDLMHIGSDGRAPNSSTVFSTDAQEAQAASSHGIDHGHVWHYCLGHMREGALRKLLMPGDGKEPVVSGKGLTLKAAQFDDCDACALSKQARRSFKSGFSRARGPLDFVHSDLMGPMKTPTFQGGRYILLIKDEWSKRRWAFVLPGKDAAAAEIMQWALREANSKGHWPRVFHSDRGTEFINNTLFTFWSSHGTRMSATLPFTPQQNGPIERENRTVIEMVRCQLVTSGAPLVLWGLCVHHTVSTLNLVLADSDGLVPVVKYDGMKPPISLDQLHPFGCTAVVNYSRGEAQQRGKFEPVARKLPYVGRAGAAGFRFISLEKGALSTVESRDCSFRSTDFSAMHELRMQLQGSELGDEEQFGEELFTDDGEFKRAIQLSLEGEHLQREEQRLDTLITEDHAAVPLPSDSEEESDGEVDEEKYERGADEYVPSSPVSPPAGPSAPRRSTRARRGVHQLGMINPDDIAEGSAWQYADIYTPFAQFLADAFFSSDEDDAPQSDAAAAQAGAGAHPGLAQERARIRNLLLFEQNQDVSEEALTKCNKHGERVMPSQQCAAPNAKGEQCKKRTCAGAFCYAHLKKLLGLRILPSEIPQAGKGLFTTVARKKGETVTTYTGDRLIGKTNPDFKGSMYVIQLNSRGDAFVDAARTNASPGRMVNAPRGTGKRPNLEWRVDRARKTVKLVALRNIRPGEELLVRYGGGYWGTISRQLHQARKLTVDEEAAPPRRKAASPRRVRLPPPALKAAPAKEDGPRRSQRFAEADTRWVAHFAVALTSTAAPPLANDGALAEPRTFAQALASPYHKEWAAAVAEELESFKTNKTFTPIYHNLSAAQRAQLLGTKWVFKLKRDETGKVVRWKARLVAQGFKQRQEDYDATFSPTLGLPQLRLIIAVAASLGYQLTQADFTAAYLNPPLDKNILIKVPEGFTEFESASALQVDKGLYGLHQSGRLWHHVLLDALIRLEFQRQLFGEQCVFVLILKNGRFIMAGLYVDDLLFGHDERDRPVVVWIMAQLHSQFKLKCLGRCRLILGIQLSYEPNGAIKMSQDDYLRRLLARLGYAQCRIEPTPASTGLLSTAKVEKQLAEEALAAAASARSADDGEEPEPTNICAASFASVLGAFAYAANATRPDIAQAVNMLARSTSAPTLEAVMGLRRVARYLAGTLSVGLTFRPPSPSKPAALVAYCDSDFAGCTETRRSTTGVALLYAGAAVVWQSRRQKSVSLSSAEAEYVALNEATREIVFIRSLLKHLQQPQLHPTTLFCDSTAAIAIAKDEKSSSRRKHLDVTHHWLREKLAEGVISLQWIETAKQPADIFTKPLPVPAFSAHRAVITGMASAQGASSL
jgi:transposase InsO family protein